MSDLRCCEMCGRDTANRGGICRYCLRGRPGYMRMQGEQIGRRVRDLRGTMRDEEPDDKNTSDAMYHGDNYE